VSDSSQVPYRPRLSHEYTQRRALPNIGGIGVLRDAVSEAQIRICNYEIGVGAAR
jgi:hypothetical protein